MALPDIALSAPRSYAGRFVAQIGTRRWLHALLLAAITLGLLLPRLDTAPPAWYDEGYNLHATALLAQQGFYGTYTTEGWRPFDSGISSGPPLIVPAALSFKLFGAGVAQARLASVLYTAAAALGLYALAAYFYGQAAALFVTLALIAFPTPDAANFLFVGRQFLGESAALAGIVVGLWLWFRAWETGRWSYSLLAGIAFSIAPLAKPHAGIPLLPTLVIIAALRAVKDRSQIVRLATPTVVMLAIFGGWMLLQRSAAQPAQVGALDMFNAIKVSFLSGLQGRPLPASAYRIFAAMAFAVLVSGWRLLARRPRLNTPGAWGEAAVVLFVLVTALWYFFLSLGWPRYAYTGFTLSLLLIAKFGYDAFQWARQKLPMRYNLQTLAMAGLALVAVVVNGYPVLQFEPENYAQETGSYIQQQIPRDAVIESWAWEIDGLSGHQEYHHPNQNYLITAVSQAFITQQPFDLDYDPLQADPDYLLAGPFSDWVGIYDGAALDAHFEMRAEFGPYRIYQRIRGE